MESEMDAEMRFHVEAYADDLERGGMARAEALRRARVEFGGMEQKKEECRDARGVSFVEGAMQDLCFGLRILRKSPVFTAIAVLTLGLGIGANTAIYSLIDAVLLGSIPVPEPKQLMVLQWFARRTPDWGYSSYGDCDETRLDTRVSGCSFSYPTFKFLRANAAAFSNLAAFAGPRQLSASANGTASVARIELVSGNYFETLRVQAFRGRTLQSADESAGAAPVVVLSYGYWRGAFGGADSAVGKTIRLNGSAFTVVGVAERSFGRLTPGKTQDMWMPLTKAASLNEPWSQGLPEDSSHMWLTIIGRVEPHLSGVQAQAATNLLFRDLVLRQEAPLFKEADEPGLALVSAQEGLVGFRSDLQTPLYLLMAAVMVVLLIACANVAGLLLARSAARQREMSVRFALGAGRVRIIRQLLTEGLLLSACGTVVGALIASWGSSALSTFLSASSSVPRPLEVYSDTRVSLFTAGVATVTSLLFGLAPALHGCRVNVMLALKERDGGVPDGAAFRSGRSSRLGSFLVTAQVALSVLVLVGAGLFIRTLINLKGIQPGFDVRNVLIFGVDPAQSGYSDKRTHTLYQELQERFAATPGVISASYVSDVLLTGSITRNRVDIEGRIGQGELTLQLLEVGPSYFETMRVPLLAGRTFAGDDLTGRPGAAIVNQSFVRDFLPGGNPVGMHLSVGRDNRELREIVGVVSDTKYDDLRKNIEPLVFLPMRDGPAYFTLRTRGNPAAAVAAVRGIVSEIDSNLPLFGFTTQVEAIDEALFEQRLVARLSSVFGFLAVVLAGIGLYGLLSYEVARRTRELGIRTALGAQQGDVLGLVLRQGLVLTLAGGITGIAAAFALMRYVRSLLYGVAPNDPLTFAIVVILVMAVAGLACCIPARRATQVEPMVALRYE